MCFGDFFYFWDSITVSCSLSIAALATLTVSQLTLAPRLEPHKECHSVRQIHHNNPAPCGEAHSRSINPLIIKSTTESHTRPTPLATGPNAPSPFSKEKRHGHEEDGDDAEDGVAPVDADVVVHGPDEEGEGAGEHGAQEHVGGDGAGAVAREGVDEVVERRLEDGREADAREEDADDRGPRVHFRVRGPWALGVSVCVCVSEGRRFGGARLTCE